MLAISLIGVPSGTEVCTFGKLPVALSDDWVELQPSEISLQAAGEVLVVSRRFIEGVPLTWVGLYRHAFEIGGTRIGNYYGAGAWLLGRSAAGVALAAVLPGLADQVQRLAMDGDRFVRRLAEIRSAFVWPEEAVDRVGHSMEAMGAAVGLGTRGAGAAYVSVDHMESTDSLGVMIDWIQSGHIFASHHRIVLGNAGAAASSARALGRLEVLDIAALRQREVEQLERASLLQTQLEGVDSALMTEREQTVSERDKRVAAESRLDIANGELDQLRSEMDAQAQAHKRERTALQRLAGELSQLKEQLKDKDLQWAAKLEQEVERHRKTRLDLGRVRNQLRDAQEHALVLTPGRAYGHDSPHDPEGHAAPPRPPAHRHDDRFFNPPRPAPPTPQHAPSPYPLAVDSRRPPAAGGRSSRKDPDDVRASPAFWGAAVMVLVVVIALSWKFAQHLITQNFQTQHAVNEQKKPDPTSLKVAQLAGAETLQCEASGTTEVRHYKVLSGLPKRNLIAALQTICAAKQGCEGVESQVVRLVSVSLMEKTALKTTITPGWSLVTVEVPTNCKEQLPADGAIEAYASGDSAAPASEEAAAAAVTAAALSNAAKSNASGQATQPNCTPSAKKNCTKEEKKSCASVNGKAAANCEPGKSNEARSNLLVAGTVKSRTGNAAPANMDNKGNQDTKNGKDKAERGANAEVGGNRPPASAASEAQLGDTSMEY